jgi:hypothetical protein
MWERDATSTDHPPEPTPGARGRNDARARLLDDILALCRRYPELVITGPLTAQSEDALREVLHQARGVIQVQANRPRQEHRE